MNRKAWYKSNIFFYIISINFTNIKLKYSRIQYDGLVNVCSFKVLFIATNLSVQSNSNKDVQYIFQQNSINIFFSCTLSITVSLYR